jgi:adenylate kinase
MVIKRIEKRKILEKRSDDDLSTILIRHETYMKTTKPVLDFYSKNPNFFEIDGALKIEEITAKIDEIINV